VQNLFAHFQLEEGQAGQLFVRVFDANSIELSSSIVRLMQLTVDLIAGAGEHVAYESLRNDERGRLVLDIRAVSAGIARIAIVSTNVRSSPHSVQVRAAFAW
jgi:hypothetical protein